MAIPFIEQISPALALTYPINDAVTYISSICWEMTAHLMFQKETGKKTNTLLF